MAEYMKDPTQEEEVDTQMPSEEQIKAMTKKKIPIFGSQKEKKFFDSADYFMEQEREKKENDDQIDKIDDHAVSQALHMNAEEQSHLPKMYNDTEVIKDHEELIKHEQKHPGEKLPGKKSRFAAMN